MGAKYLQRESGKGPVMDYLTAIGGALLVFAGIVALVLGSAWADGKIEDCINK